ncbi:MAG: oxidoreductase [Marmoricola sp.]|nr:oxidoreductase [Marmoricola sp.]
MSAPPPDPLAWLSDLDGVPSGFTATRDGIDVLLRDRGLRRTSPAQTTESLLVGAHASAVLEGSASSQEEVRSGAGDDLALAALRVGSELLSLAPVLGRSPLQAFARLHVLAGGAGAPASAEGADRLQSLSRTLLATKAPALMVAAIAHADLVTARPFGHLDGLVARAVERLVLVSRGVDPASLVVPEAGHLALRAAYESNLRGYRDGGRAGVHSWLLYAAEAQAKGAELSPLRQP